MRDRVQSVGVGIRGRPAQARNPRFRQLLDKARDGDENAVGYLWREFHFDFEKEGGRHE
jgi:hypothetical protein